MTAAVPPVFGYAAGESWLHRANPLAKLAWLVAAVAVVLVSYQPPVLLGILLIGAVLALASGTLPVTARTVVALAPVGASIIVIQALTGVACSGAACTPLASLGPLVIVQEGLSRGLVLVTRLLALEVVAVPLLATTHPSDLFAALRRLRLPYELAVMASLAIQLVPQLQRELHEVMAAQRARGLRARGIGALAPALVPVVAGAFDRMTTLVLGLEARGLGAGPRTSYRRVDLRPIDVTVAVAGCVAAVAGTWLALAMGQGSAAATSLVVPAPVAVGVVAAAVVVFVAVIVRAARGLAGR